jgi:hypothetical protein
MLCCHGYYHCDPFPLATVRFHVSKNCSACFTQNLTLVWFMRNGKTSDFVGLCQSSVTILALQCIIDMMLLTAATVNVPVLLTLPGDKGVVSSELKWDVSR